MTAKRTRSPGDKQLAAVRGLLGPGAVLDAGADNRATARPTSAAEVAALVRLAHSERFGLELCYGPLPPGPGLALSLERFDRLGAVDTRSMLVTVGAGLACERLEQSLSGAGFRPVRGLDGAATVGAFLARSPVVPVAAADGQAEPCIGLDAVLADGTIVSSKVTPRSAAGPDVKHLLLGSRGALGVILEATLRLEPLGLSRAELAWRFPSVGPARDAADRLHGDGCVWPASARIFEQAHGVVLAVALSGHAEVVDAAVRACRERIAGLDCAELAALETREALAMVPDQGADAPPAELGEALERIKKQLDPRGLFNPGAWTR